METVLVVSLLLLGASVFADYRDTKESRMEVEKNTLVQSVVRFIIVLFAVIAVPG